MIESNIIKWLDFGDSTQNLDVYSKKSILIFFKLLKSLVKYKYFPITLNVVFIIIYFMQIWTINIINILSEGDVILEIFDYLKKLIIFYEIITNELTYKKLFIILLCIILIDIIFIIFTLLFKRKNISISIFYILINYLNIVIFYYFIGPSVNILLISTWCENGSHIYLGSTCYTTSHLIYFIISIIIFLLSFVISFIYSFYCNEIELITTNLSGSNARINCNYELLCLISKIIIFILGFYVRTNNKEILKLIYEIYIFVNSLIMSIYIYKNVYYYNDVINYLNMFGWLFSIWFSFCILLKTVFHLKYITNLIIIGWLIISISLYKTYKMKEYSLITEVNIFEFKSTKSIEMYKNILINKLREKNTESKIIIYGIIKKFEEFAINNPEINMQYHKLLNDKLLSKKFGKEDELPIFSIIYILYSFYLDKLSNKEEITLHMCYFLINNLNNPTYSMLLCSKLKNENHKCLYYKYLLIEDIKKYLIFKLNKNSNKESIRHVQIGSVILYYLYIYLFKIKIYDAICNQIDYFDLLKNNISTNKLTQNFLKTGKRILRSRKEILIIWEKIIQLNPFSDECQKDYILYLDSILQDEILSREESKKYMLFKNSKFQEKDNIYYSMFLIDSSSILLVDGFLAYGKILYATQNFSYLFMYNNKEILNITIDDLLPNCIQTFHKELIDDAIKYSNLNYIFKKPKDSFIKNKNGGIFNVNLFVKPVPNLNYGLIYYTYIQKVHEANFIIIIDKDLKINGYTEISQAGSSFTLSNGFNLPSNILGYHICIFIPDILALIEYKNDQFYITKKDCELKGYLYPVEKLNNLKYLMDTILTKIKENKINENNNQGETENDTDNLSSKIKEMIRELNNQKVKPFSIFYKIKLFNFLNDKYKYYRIYIYNDIISNNENKSIAKEILVQDESNIYKSNISKNKKKIIKRMKEKNSKINNNDNENSVLSLDNKNNNNNNINLENKERSDNNIAIDNQINKEKNNNQIESLSSNESRPYNINLFNKLKNYIINQKNIYPLKVIFFLGFIFTAISIIFMIYEFSRNKSSFKQLNTFLNDNIFFNNTKIISASLSINAINIRWLSFSLYLNSTACISGDFVSFYKDLLIQNIDFLESLKNELSTLGEHFQKIIFEKHPIEMNIYRSFEPDIYNFNLDNIITFLMNTGIKIVDNFSEFYPENCKIKFLELGGVNIKNLDDISYYLYNSNIIGYTGKEKTKLVNKYINIFPFPLLIFCIFSIILLIAYGKYLISILNIELYFLEKLVNFNSLNFDNYIKRIDEIKKKLRNDSIEEEDKGDDIDSNDAESKKINVEDGDEMNNSKKNNTEKEEKRKKKKKNGKQSKILQQRKKKLKIMKSFFSRNNLFFALKTFAIVVPLFLYYIISIILRTYLKNNFLEFDAIRDSTLNIYKDSFDILIILTKELNNYVFNLIDCKTVRDFNLMNIPKINDLSSPTLGNILLQISESSDFNEFTLQEFNTLFRGDSCKFLSINSDEYKICENFWGGILLRGIEQSLIYMGVIISNVLDELEIINNIKNNLTLYDLMSGSAYIEYKQFIEFYMLRAYNKTNYILKDLSIQKISSIIRKIRLLLIIYLIISIFLLGFNLYIIISYKNVFNSFLNFICILPIKYIFEDESFCLEIIQFGKKYF